MHHVIHHNDLDGKTSAAIVAKYLSERHAELLNNDDIKFYEMDYSKKTPTENIHPGDYVYIVDYSVQPNEMALMISTVGHDNLVWIDHHKTAIAKYAGLPMIENIKGYRTDDKPAACALCWDYFFPDIVKPEAVMLASDWDTWTFAFGEDTKDYKYGMDAENISPGNALMWKALLSGGANAEIFVRQICSNGRSIRKYIKARAIETLRATGKAIKVLFPEDLGLGRAMNIIISNQPLINSEYFESVYEDYDIYCPFYYNGSRYVVSMYTRNKDIDVSEICKSLGGGGHRQAAGFSCDTLPEWMIGGSNA